MFHLISRDTSEAHILERLQRRLALAQLDVGAGDPLGSANENDGTPCGTPLTHLESEASRECSRLMLVQSLRHSTIDRIPAPTDDLLVAFSHRRELRLQLSGRILAIAETTIEDDFGRAVAVHLTPMAVTTSAPTEAPRRGVDDVWRALQGVEIERVDSQIALWRDESSRIHQAFWSTRLTRERAMGEESDIASAFGLRPVSFDISFRLIPPGHY